MRYVKYGWFRRVFCRIAEYGIDCGSTEGMRTSALDPERGIVVARVRNKHGTFMTQVQDVATGWSIYTNTIPEGRPVTDYEIGVLVGELRGIRRNGDLRIISREKYEG
jgi:hypothetical protein